MWIYIYIYIHRSIRHFHICSNCFFPPGFLKQGRLSSLRMWSCWSEILRDAPTRSLRVFPPPIWLCKGTLPSSNGGAGTEDLCPDEESILGVYPYHTPYFSLSICIIGENTNEHLHFQQGSSMIQNQVGFVHSQF